MKHLGTKRLETDRLILRRFTIEDASDMFENWAKDPEVTKYLTWQAHTDLDETEEVITRWEDETIDDNVYQWAIECKEIGQVIGSISAVNMNEKVQSVEIGYCIGRAFWRKGYTSEALAEVMRFFFEEVGANRVEARCDVRNQNSAKVMEKCGMVYEGTSKAADWNMSGICDCARYAKVLRSAALLESCGGLSEEEEEPLPKQAAVAVKIDGKNVISDETIDYVGILAKLELNNEEKEQAKKDIGEMLDYIDQLNELDTEGVEPMSHVFPVYNVFREDVVTNGDGSAQTLANAPSKKDGGFKVPKTIGE